MLPKVYCDHEIKMLGSYLLGEDVTVQSNLVSLGSSGLSWKRAWRQVFIHGGSRPLTNTSPLETMMSA